MVNSDVREVIKIWDVIDGPYPAGIPEREEAYYNVCKVELNGKISEIEYVFGSFNSAYEMVKYFQTNIEPIEVNSEDSI